MNENDIYSYIKTEESAFDTEEIRVGSNWNWNFKAHVQLIFHLKNGIFFTGANNWSRAFKNIMEAMLNLAYWTEDLEVKDIVFFIEQSSGRILSFLVKKYHDEIYARENNLDTMLDEITESDLDFGGVLVQKTSTGRPEILPLTTIAFCDQTDILGGPIGFKHFFSPDKLRSMAKYGWGDEANGATVTLDKLITLAEASKDPAGLSNQKKNRTTGKVIEVYIVRGNLPQSYLSEDGDAEDYINQVQIVAFYTDKKGKQQGVTLYRKKESEGTLKFFTSKEIYGRALGRGVGETLLHTQVWTNFLTTHKMKLIEAGSKVPLWTDDANYGARNKIQDMENLEITTIAEGRQIGRVPTGATENIKLFDNAVSEWFEHAQLEGAAFDPILGKEQASGTTFRGQERTVAQGRGMHDRRRGQRAKFIEEIYRDFIIPDIVKQITKGKKFLASLTSDELLWISDQLSENYANRQRNEAVLNGELPPDKEQLKQEFKLSLAKQGNKHLIEILKDEFEDIEIRIGINIAGKQKDLVNLTDKLLSIFQYVFTNPVAFQQAMQVPALARSFQDILEFSGMDQSQFLSLLTPPPQPQLQAAPGQPVPQGQQGQPGQPQPQIVLNPPAPAA